MSRAWKVLTVLSLVLNGVCLLYLYAISHPNPYSSQYYETEQVKLELRQLRNGLCELRASRTPQAGQGEKACAS
ncbi:hypothetical protein [Noviherbaspirillum autotrophicum]|nr:hypothetical protein [Noviherbaspirillum autotrophicum]